MRQKNQILDSVLLPGKSSWEAHGKHGEGAGKRREGEPAAHVRVTGAGSIASPARAGAQSKTCNSIVRALITYRDRTPLPAALVCRGTAEPLRRARRARYTRKSKERRRYFGRLFTANDEQRGPIGEHGVGQRGDRRDCTTGYSTPRIRQRSYRTGTADSRYRCHNHRRKPGSCSRSHNHSHNPGSQPVRASPTKPDEPELERDL